MVSLRELSGHDEECVGGTSTDVAIDLLDRLLVNAPHSVLGPGAAARLPAPDRDRLLAMVYRDNLGKRVESTLSCAGCDASFDIDFQLEEFVESRTAEVPAIDADGYLPVENGGRIRPPTGEEELAVVHLSPEAREPALLRQCYEPNGEDHSEKALETLERDAPLLELDVDTRCPECGLQQRARFSLQSYLLERIANERRQRAGEIHRLARAYGWSLHEILGLSRTQRRVFVSLIDRESH
ncbi:MAG: hypothetical protein AAGF12_16520 [Myxococcota bacterium]